MRTIKCDRCLKTIFTSASGPLPFGETMKALDVVTVTTTKLMTVVRAEICGDCNMQLDLFLQGKGTQIDVAQVRE